MEEIELLIMILLFLKKFNNILINVKTLLKLYILRYIFGTKFDC